MQYGFNSREAMKVLRLQKAAMSSDGGSRSDSPDWMITLTEETSPRRKSASDRSLRGGTELRPSLADRRGRSSELKERDQDNSINSSPSLDSLVRLSVDTCFISDSGYSETEMKSFICIAALVAVGLGNEIRIVNRCPFSVCPGILGNPGHGQPENGGFVLGANETKVINVPFNWGGRIWPRTKCDANGHCQTGDCGNRLQCNGNGGTPPVSLAEITFAGAGGLDFYDISLVDGYNLPIKMAPISGFTGGNGHAYDCRSAGCHTDLNAICPPELSVKDGPYTVACLSACMKFDTDQYCCRNAHGVPENCKSSDWPHNYPAIFKQACPDAYSYAYDDTTSTFTCRGNPATNYEVVFCP
ncbi:hypothetical protein GE061_013626 [Apolygus lucorum]|uniref:Thaumatin-like protein n=1 Tax=Apolygus lucorum TaxID=248454 RepID=A0A8S9XNB4_APOLU|nr:hypothetical protein GE061_013626 [Apolygus lucorum]